jgi:hypothetical protein
MLSGLGAEDDLDLAWRDANHAASPRHRGHRALNDDAAAPSTVSLGSHEELDGEVSGSNLAANSDMATGITNTTGGGSESFRR